MTEDQAKTKWPIRGYKGRRTGHSKGYIRVLSPLHPNAMSDGYVYEHVYVGSLVLDRGIGRYEVVHHINGNRSDNRNENLLICSKKYHQQLHARLEQSDNWPQFITKKRNHRPSCSACEKLIPYNSKTGYCWTHYWENFYA